MGEGDRPAPGAVYRAQGARAICKLIPFGEQLHRVDMVSGQQALAKGPGLSPGNSLG
jgi:hypothetical protein